MQQKSILTAAIAAALLSLSQSPYAAYIDGFVIKHDLETTEGSFENPDRAQAIYWGNGKILSITSENITATAKKNAIWVTTESIVNIQGSKLLFSAGSSTSEQTDISTLSIQQGSTLNVTGTDITVEALSNGTQAVNAIKADLGGPNKAVTIKVGSRDTNSINIIASGNNKSYALLNFGSLVELEAKDIKITSSGHGVGNNATNTKLALPSNTKINGENITIEAEGFGLTNNESQMLIEAESLTINSGMGIHVGNNTQDENPSSADRAHTVINASSTTINADTHGILAFSNGIIDISGDLTVNAPIAIDARGYSTVNINQDGKGAVVLNGDISFETPGPQANSGDVIDAYVNINLSGSESSWTGNVSREYPANADADSIKVTGLVLTLSDEAQWNPTIIKDWSSPTDGTVGEGHSLNTLNFNGGVINVRHGADQVVQIDNVTGTGGTVNLTATTDNGESIQSGSVSIGKSAENVALQVNAVGITSDDIKNPEAALESLNEKVTGDVAKVNTFREGDVTGAITQSVSADGQLGTVHIAQNTKLASMKGLNAATLVAWRDEVAHTNQRLEFLRDSSHAYGAWAQVYGGESSYDDADVDLKSTTVQVGADAAVGEWVIGGAFSYMDGDADFANGSADAEAYTVSLYAAREFDSGFYLNALARYGRLSADATTGNMTGSYDNDAFSFGGNVGYHCTFAQHAFFEPQIGLQYAYVAGDDYTATNGVKVKQDDFDALVASFGARVGFNFAENAGKFFARASVNHDFLGEIDGTAANDKAIESMYVDLGGTWVTYGVGAQFNCTDSLSVWANVDRSNGGDVSTHYMMNAGLRYVF